jgi:RNA polymerase sigma-70 factor, ECF subfamily
VCKEVKQLLDEIVASQHEELMTDKERFADCVVQQLPFLNRMVRGLTRNDPLADDIIQQTVLKALVHADQFRFDSTLRTWLTSIALNEMRQVYRCKWRTHSAPLITESVESAGSPLAQSPHWTYHMREREVLIRQAVSRLPEMYRCVVELCDLQDLPLKEAADRLRITIGAVKSRLQRARTKLRPFIVKLKV